jgi:hypothetical protein
MPTAAGTVARWSTGHRLITALRAVIRRLANRSAPPVPAAATRAGRTHRCDGYRSWRNVPTSKRAPPAEPSQSSSPPLRSPACQSAASSWPGSRSSPAPTPPRTARAASRAGRGRAGLTRASVARSTPTPTARPIRVARPAAMPWWTEVRGINEYPNESSRAAVSSATTVSGDRVQPADDVQRPRRRHSHGSLLGRPRPSASCRRGRPSWSRAAARPTSSRKDDVRPEPWWSPASGQATGRAP